jgi:hypothetical protein
VEFTDVEKTVSPCKTGSAGRLSRYKQFSESVETHNGGCQRPEGMGSAEMKARRPRKHKLRHESFPI